MDPIAPGMGANHWKPHPELWPVHIGKRLNLNGRDGVWPYGRLLSEMRSPDKIPEAWNLGAALSGERMPRSLNNVG